MNTEWNTLNNKIKTNFDKINEKNEKLCNFYQDLPHINSCVKKVICEKLHFLQAKCEPPFIHVERCFKIYLAQNISATTGYAPIVSLENQKMTRTEKKVTSWGWAGLSSNSVGLVSSSDLEYRSKLILAIWQKWDWILGSVSADFFYSVEYSPKMGIF